MRFLMISMGLVAGLVLGSTALAETHSTTHPAAASTAAVQIAGGPARSQPGSTAKLRTCANTWGNQKTRVGSREAFMVACVSKG